jgi:hypothetical protein
MKRILIVLLLGLTGCTSGKLTRSQAEAIINKKQAAGGFYTPMVITHIGKMSGYCSDFSRLGGTAAQDDQLTSQVYNFPLLQKLGALNVERVGQPYIYNITLTDFGKQVAGEPYGHTTFESTCDSWQVDLQVLTWDKATVTGIVQDGVLAKVETLLCRKPTAFGAKFLEVPEEQRKFLLNNEYNLGYLRSNGDYCKSDEFAFEKFDDGWRLK